MLYEILAEPEVVEFLYQLDPAGRAAADHRACLLAEQGPTLGEPYSRNLGDGVRELRFALSTSQQARITYWFPGGPLIIMLTAFIKQRQREMREVERAKLARKLCEAQHDRTYEHIITL
ncbi:type II toxin-antitoxin system RelE/ParE family toxin [Nocardia arthritidis]|uniref:type II toxin-antitoxin system RelE/ParE family toxin n=1 Tax=Nocardia arthritidis TaxID=228602 RepID=UPI00142DFB0B|nr:type II toxin-antitoxin system RelE/ParE family toxin [Nocardia arthritidis]